jgi:hypothetical protein
MKKLKKFNENWIDDETEDTNARMAKLDNEEGISNVDFSNPDNIPSEYIERAERIITIFHNESKALVDEIDDKYGRKNADIASDYFTDMFEKAAMDLYK